MEKKQAPEPDSNNPDQNDRSKEDIFKPIEELKGAQSKPTSASDKSITETELELVNARRGEFSPNDNAKELGENKAKERVSGGNLKNPKPEEESKSKNTGPEAKNPVSSESSAPTASELYKIPSTPLKGKYEFIQVIGAGGAGVIYKAKQNPLGRLVAIKMVHSHIVSQRSLKRFEQEAKTISNLVHPNIISIHDFGVSEDQQPYMVMDFMDGEPLSEYIKRNQRLSLEETISYANQICDGLSHAHAKGILHRDLKPNNIMLVPLESGENHIKILDFGLAKLLHEDEENPGDHLTKTGETVGTPAYMSPEQVMGKNMDRQTDVYALGCVIYHCLTGSPPFVGETKMETMLMHLNKAPTPVNELLQEEIIDPLFDSLILKLLAKDPKERFASMQEVKRAINEAKRGLFTSVQTAPKVKSDHSTKPKERLEETKKTNESDLAPQKNKGLIIALCALALIGFPLTMLVFNLNKPVEKFTKEKETETQKLPEPEEMPDQMFKSNIETEVRKQDDNNKASHIIRTNGLKISDRALLFLEKVHNLHELYLDGSPITDRGLEHIIRFKGIQVLSLKNTKVTDNGMKTLSLLPQLQVLDLTNSQITDEALPQIGECKKLISLNLANTKITSKNLSSISTIQGLKILNLSKTKITDNNLQSLANLKNLTELVVTDTAIGDKGALAISKIESLRNLELAGTKISKEALKHIANLKYLGSLDLSRTNLNDSCLNNLKKISGLDRLKLKQCKISQDTIRQYLRNEPQCKVHKGPE